MTSQEAAMIETTDETTWTWADLDEQGLALIAEAERTLDADFVLVYRPGEDEFDVPAEIHLPPTTLDETQLECLQGLERIVGGVAVAYRAG
jgi:hypothetical protein